MREMLAVARPRTITYDCSDSEAPMMHALVVSLGCRVLGIYGLSVTELCIMTRAALIESLRHSLH